ncbi:pentatricopeptide repeat-containing protein At1g06710, mitochondrial-like isoform X2 [Nymphaea colorata]|nr:pentatricopeptide repeat-containing protein At1g06710, mitochondrial-like isoform X2 [Nymphaea colorata]
MIRRCAKMVLYESMAISCKSSSWCPLKLQNIRFRTQVGNTHVVFSTLSNDDDLSGLDDPNFLSIDEGYYSSPEAEKGYAKGSVKTTMDDFSFLAETVPGSDGGLESAEGREVGPRKYSRDATLISDAISADGYDWKNESFLRRFREKLNVSLVIDVLRLVKKPEPCVKFFIWAGRQIGYRHSGLAYNALLDILMDAKRIKIPECFLLEFRDADDEILGKLLNILITKCCRNGMWNQALEELGRLKDFGYRPTKTTYIALIHVLLKAERLDLALAVYNEMTNSAFEVDRFTLGCFVRSLCKNGRWKDALGLIDKEEIVPDAVLYTKMIRGLCEASMMDEAVAFLHRMRASSCFPNSVTYGTIIIGFLKSRQLGRCKKIFNQMISEGCYPSPRVFNCFIHAVCKSGEYAYAYKMLKKMSGAGHHPGYVAYNILVSGICAKEDLPGAEDMQLAEAIYAEMLDAGYVLNKINVEHIARCLCGHGKPDRAYRIIGEMMCRGFMPETSTYNKVIELLCQSKKVEKALHLFEEMKKINIVPNVFTYTILIDNFCKVGLLQQARNWFNEMVSNGSPPNVVTYTALIHAYLKARQVFEANKLFEMMLAEGCTPNIVTYTALIDGHCKAGNVDKACQIYARMRGSGSIHDIEMYFEPGAADTDMKPNVVTYGALIDGLCKAHKVVEANDLLEAMSRDSCEPNHVVYDALIDGFCKLGKLDEAQSVFQLMGARGYSPNVFTYSSLMDRLFKDKRLDLALKVLSKMLENGCAPNVITYTEMIDGLCKIGKTDEAHKLLLMMEEKGCHPNVVTYTAIIDGYGKVGKVYVCLDLLEQMTKKGCAPNLVTYRVLINHCCAAGLLDEARNFLDEMKQIYWPEHSIGYGEVIQGFSKEFIASLGLLDEITRYSSVPILPAYGVLLDALCKGGRLEVALELHKEVLQSSPVRSSFYRKTYSSLIEALCLATKVEKGFELYSDMISRGCTPELTVLVHLIKGLCLMNKWSEALQLASSICSMEIIWLHNKGAFDQS